MMNMIYELVLYCITLNCQLEMVFWNIRYDVNNKKKKRKQRKLKEKKKGMNLLLF